MSAATQGGIDTIPRHGQAVEPGGQALRALKRPARNRDLPDMLGPQMNAGELGHLAGAENQHRAPLQVAENLLGECNRGVADRDGAFAEPGLRADPLADGECGMKQPIRERGGELPVARDGVGRFDLTQNLRLSNDERVQPG